ncbi:protein-export membrane protein SecG [Hartmannibacter diazotrophicus]|uniref:Protein-export membrane protein SecG n=1 Tax=Hartmannibacter diazotrophicus TaxID=1482074 RepID=A0A2C9D445_9HYPH|nr:preprotein translocase subunit SecG [Hartmannibacter diazotrophicus]SON55064.1 protein-export membrane protein SecG [Hartmannibacter diazotrophicus]
MQTVILVIHLMVIVALVGVVLIQRSEGGALGIGGGGGGFMTSRGSANVLTRATAILAAIFFVTSIALTVLPRLTGSSGSILDSVAPGSSSTLPDTSGSGNGILDQLNKMKAPAPAGAPQPAAPQPGAQVPASEAPAAPAAQAPAAAPSTGDVPSLSDAPVTEPPATTDTPAAQ